MSKYELSLTTDYAHNWTLSDGIRELFQNALDAETQDPKAIASWDYIDDVFTITSADTKLETRSLLLGASSKQQSTNTIGQFGEGYKIATLVLLREGYNVVIHNRAANEIWEPRFVNSRRYGAQILTFFVKRNKYEGNDLTIEVSGIRRAAWESQVIPTNLHLQDNIVEVESNPIGSALSSPEHTGKVYVNGLFVCEYPHYHFGYDFNPGELALDRDRKLVSDFDLGWLASTFWVGSPRVMEFIKAGYEDVRFTASISGASDLRDRAYNEFRKMYGALAVPVISQWAVDSVPSGHTPIIVSENWYELIVGSSYYVAPVDDSASPKERLRDWYESISYGLSPDKSSEFEDIFRVL